MATPITEKEQFSFPAFPPNGNGNADNSRSSDEDGTLQDDGVDPNMDANHLRVQTSYAEGHDQLTIPQSHSPMSPSQQREQSQRLDDDLEVLRAERVVSAQNAENEETESSVGRSRSMVRSRSRIVEPVDDFDVGTTPIHEKTKVYQPPAHPASNLGKLFKTIHNSSFLVRYFTYIFPVVIIILIPLLLGALVFKHASVGGVYLFWFSVWLEILWLTLWAGRILAKCLPYPMGLISSLFTNSDKKWRDLGKQLEIPATLFFWGLAVQISFLPTMTNHHTSGNKKAKQWEIVLNKVIIAFFVAAVLNFIEKIIIQLIAISFHLRTYSDRIEVNKFQIASLIKLYIYSKAQISMEDSEFEARPSGPTSGARTPMLYVEKASKNARHIFHRVGDVAGKVAGDFTGRVVVQSTQPQQVVLQLLGSTSGSQVLARRLYRTFAHEDSEVVLSDDLRPAFDNNDEADAAFTMFDKDLNGDISMEELEAVCVEIGRERKAITASLKDLDSVVSKLNDVFVFIVVVIAILVFVSIISTSASGVLTSLGSSVLALSWLFSATAQEFLQSVIFVFVKHPFDVGDRVTIYGNTGVLGKGDDYFVKEISLLYTEFKKMEGHVVQAPNSYLNTLFILNQRRSGGLAEAVPVTVKFGTTLEQIESLRNRLLEFVTFEKREYQKNILTELTTVYEAYSVTLNVVFFYKSNWQNELLRLQRRNKFICALMVTMQDLGIEGPRQRLAGQSADVPIYLHGAYPPPPGTQTIDSSQPFDGPGPSSGSLRHELPFVPEAGNSVAEIDSHPSILRRGGRARGESVSQMSKRVDFSLGMSAISSGAEMGDVYEDREKPRIPVMSKTSPSPARGGRTSQDDNSSLARSSTIDSRLQRVDSGTGSMQTHRNRFFGRSKRRGIAEEGTAMQDLEAGVRSLTNLSSADMPDIPEASGATSCSAPITQPLARSGSGSKIDPRTGIVSPQAVSDDRARDRGELPRAYEPENTIIRE
ncbi:MAG: hypothetical protein M1818_000807 [Claussenomyces sp. TS43310]|nr:MAG: hypothetical protein M1818_000807 [Claussenomyces sp. TS43310]